MELIETEDFIAVDKIKRTLRAVIGKVKYAKRFVTQSPSEFFTGTSLECQTGKPTRASVNKKPKKDESTQVNSIGKRSDEIPRRTTRNSTLQRSKDWYSEKDNFCVLEDELDLWSTHGNAQLASKRVGSAKGNVISGNTIYYTRQKKYSSTHSSGKSTRTELDKITGEKRLTQSVKVSKEYEEINEFRRCCKCYTRARCYCDKENRFPIKARKKVTYYESEISDEEEQFYRSSKRKYKNNSSAERVASRNRVLIEKPETWLITPKKKKSGISSSHLVHETNIRNAALKRQIFKPTGEKRESNFSRAGFTSILEKREGRKVKRKYDFGIWNCILTQRETSNSRFLITKELGFLYEELKKVFTSLWTDWVQQIMENEKRKSVFWSGGMIFGGNGLPLKVLSGFGVGNHIGDKYGVDAEVDVLANVYESIPSHLRR
ncbi:hypothetical protein AX774_g1926 [Zancudomyces culisetae]|uniref:Uncharacterized protein n=1 Tax=Zancudomyces culisetae TaxID=1213189 RepID=A0A1R1PU90_ZANCU|nr:hypothetical protein AX774_g3399 [Zancudomyces culisetae]OMH84555.1 hypothetical protein AX774_g1926 [Zancudomyces culisetae]|eukprot:OMH83101.1 hypothetical protein AX774_g3399 [Zancudomyces culisetae]